MASSDLGLFRDGLHVLADAVDSGRLVTGAAKIGQRFIYHLMTRLGSKPQSTDGCEFVTRLLSDKAATELDVFTALCSSISDVVRKIRAEEADEDPADEILAGVKIEQLLLESSNLLLTLRLRMQSGDTTRVTPSLSFLLS